MAQVRRRICRETGRECAGRPCVPGRAGPAACPGPCCAGPPPRPGRQAAGRPGAHRPGLVGARPDHRQARLVRRHVPAGGPPPSAEAPDDDAYLAMIHPDDRPAAVALRQQGFSTGHRDVYRVVHPDGAVRHLQAWTDVERDAHGAVVKVVGATIDVTEREELLASLDVGRANLAAALELTRTAHLGVGRRDRAAHLVGADVRADGPGPVGRRRHGWTSSSPACTPTTRRGSARWARSSVTLRGRPGDRLPGAAPRRLRAPRARLDRRTPVG